MRSVVKFLLYTFVIILVPTIIMIIVSLLGSSGAYLILGQILVILALMGFFFLFLKKEKAYEEKTLKEIENEDNLEKLRAIRDEKLSYKSKGEITRKILTLEYSPEEMALLKKYATSKELMDFYYAKLIKEDRQNREENKNRRDSFNKRFGKRRHVYVDFKDVLYTALKWTGIFAIFASLAISKIHYKFFDPYWAYAISMILFIICAFLTINTIIWIIRAMKAHWVKDYI